MSDQHMKAALREDSPFYDIFPNGMVPVRCLVPAVVELEQVGAERCYMLDGDRCTSEQMEAVAQRVAERFNARVSDVRDELITHGLPIRESQVRCGPAIDLRFIL